MTKTDHGKDFVLKGGVLLAAYGARRPTKDVDAEAISSTVTAGAIARIVSDIVSVPADDGVEFGYAPETVLAEKGVTVLERGTTSTRWRDYVDIVRLASIYDVHHDLLLASAQAVADYRGVDLTAVGPMLAGYGSISQPKWAAWRRKEGLEESCDESLDAQVAAVAALLDPVFTRGRAAASKPE